VFLTRPQRFGKSLLVVTLEVWFQGLPKNMGTPETHEAWSNWLFVGTERCAAWRNQVMRPVIRLDMARVHGEMAEDIRRSLLSHLRRVYTTWARRGVSLDCSAAVLTAWRL